MCEEGVCNEEASVYRRLRGEWWRKVLSDGCREQAGSTMVEFALILLTLLTLTFGMIDFSRAVYANSVVQAAAQTGARAGIVSLASVTPAVLDKMVGLDLAQVQVAVTQPNADSVAVQVTYQFELVTPFLAAAIAGGGINLTGSASMLVR
jgi:Flp pilus assembly protein TadG